MMEKFTIFGFFYHMRSEWSQIEAEDLAVSLNQPPTPGSTRGPWNIEFFVADLRLSAKKPRNEQNKGQLL
jgi:hypothetical protein